MWLKLASDTEYLYIDFKFQIQFHHPALKSVDTQINVVQGQKNDAPLPSLITFKFGICKKQHMACHQGALLLPSWN